MKTHLQPSCEHLSLEEFVKVPDYRVELLEAALEALNNSFKDSDGFEERFFDETGKLKVRDLVAANMKALKAQPEWESLDLLTALTLIWCVHVSVWEQPQTLEEYRRCEP